MTDNKDFDVLAGGICMAHCNYLPCVECDMPEAITHASDCAVHNGPAFSAGMCDCSPGKKADTGKVPVWSGLLEYFPDALEAVAHTSGGGFDKYGGWGLWRRVPEAMRRYSEALVRHVLDSAKGVKFSTDPKLRTGTRIRAQVAWNALATLQLEIEQERTAAGDKDAGRPSPNP